MFNSDEKYTPEYKELIDGVYKNLDDFTNTSGLCISTEIISDNDFDVIAVIDERFGTTYPTCHTIVNSNRVISLIDVNDGSDVQVMKALMKSKTPDGFTFKYVFSHVFKSNDGVIKSNCVFIEN